jgi:hypothetical protein
VILLIQTILDWRSALFLAARNQRVAEWKGELDRQLGGMEHGRFE